ncbi:hypothetical protein NFI95_02425 [Acetobacteraceae bacterium KSS8]|uniref:Uncharacterized protein n=1 Tax=Endosaccharibacter trunci TaxID=2812733 RepID=A0ABT1W4F9_9PROT|nr:hypothetical protein [Acetobacteraceae bacterium KSS8]
MELFAALPTLPMAGRFLLRACPGLSTRPRHRYRDVLGVTLRYDAEGHPPVLVLNALARATTYMAPSTVT